MRGTIAKRMHQSLQQMAQLTLFMDADVDAVVADRNARKAAGGVTPSYTDYVIAAVTRALVEHPIVNSQITEDGVALLPTVHVGMAAHPANVAPSADGHSIGRWDNDVLVVDTVGFVPGTLMGSTPHSGELHVVERFSVDTATTTLKREVTAEDPLYFTAPYTSSNTMIVSTVPYAAEACADLTPVVPPAPTAAPAPAR